MLCIACTGERLSYVEEDVVDVRRGMVLVKNIAVGILSMGSGSPCEALRKGSVTAIGRVIEAPTRAGAELVGRIIFYRPHTEEGVVCTFSEGDPGEAFEVGPEAAGSMGILSAEAQLALSYSRRAGASPLIIGGGFTAQLALYTLQARGVRGYTVGRSFRGVEAVALNPENAPGRRYSSVYIAGIPSEEERRVLEALTSGGALKIYAHPAIRLERIYIPLGDRVCTRILSYTAPHRAAIELASRFKRVAKGYSYIEATSSEEPPAAGDLIVITLSHQ